MDHLYEEKINETWSVLHKTGLKYDANFLYKRHISSKIRHSLATSYFRTALKGTVS